MISGRSISIQGLGLDARFKAMLQVFFERRRRTPYQFVNQQADIIVADIDALGVRRALAEARKDQALKPTILFSIDASEFKTGGDLVVLRKPFTVKQLVSAFDIMDLQVRVGSQRLTAISTLSSTRRSNSQAGPVDVAIEAEAPRAQFSAATSLSGKGDYVKLNTLLSMALEQNIDEEGLGGQDGQAALEYDTRRYLQGALLKAHRKAREKNNNILIEFGSGTITIDVKRSLVQMGMGSFQLRELASFPLNKKKVNISLLPRRQARVDSKSGRTIVPLESLIWKVALFASRGRAPQGTNFDAPVSLKSWPNFTRLLLSPGALRMAALWTAHSFSISQLSTTLKLSNADVLSFYSAAHAIELIHFGDDIEEAVVPPAKISGVKGLLGNILKKLHT